MLIYGTAIYLMSRMDEKSDPYSKTAMLLFFLGFTNLILGWAHHIYQLPSGVWIRYLAYLISMTELIVLAQLIWTWMQNIRAAGK
ncbi:MAG: hypothetical protein IIC75_02530, partial [Bacteroidetes bacterium]|nr:hypothetical protein [Bacteroidota bacterium]